jgi:phenylacetate-CoA ligase
MRLLRHLPRFKAARQALAELEAREKWSRAQIDSFQLERLNRLWDSTVKHAPYYRELTRTHGLPREFSSLSHFQAVCPILDKDMVRTRQKDFLSDIAGKGTWFHSGGSTGKPASYFRSNEAHREILRGRYRSHAMWGVDIFDRWAFLWGHAASFAPGMKGQIERWKRPLSDWLRSRLRLSAYDLSSQSLRKHLQKIDKFRPAAIYAYSTAAYLLAKEAKAIGFHCPSLKMLVMTAEPAFPHIVKECEEAFGVPAVAEYGSAETNTLAFECPDRTLRVRDDIFFVETPKREDGRYDIVITVLNSLAFPLIRYAIGDVTNSPLIRPDAGFTMLGNIAGRHQDLIIDKSGQPIFAGWFEDVLEHQDAVRRYQVHQNATGELIVHLELQNSQAVIDKDRIQRVFGERTGFGVTVEVDKELPPSRAGKHRWITSDLAVQKNMQFPS